MPGLMLGKRSSGQNLSLSVPAEGNNGVSGQKTAIFVPAAGKKGGPGQNGVVGSVYCGMEGLQELVEFVDLVVVAGVEAAGHAEDYAGAAVGEDHEGAGGGVDAKAFYLAGAAKAVHGLVKFHPGFALQFPALRRLAARCHVPGVRAADVQVVRRAGVGVAVVAGYEDLSPVGAENALLKVRSRVEGHLAEVLAAGEVIAVKVTAAHPVRHPHKPARTVHCESAAFHLPRGRLPGEGPPVLQGGGIVDGHLDVLPNAVHEVLAAGEDLTSVHVDVADMIGSRRAGGDGVEGRLVAEKQLALQRILVERAGAGHVVVLAVTRHALAPGHFQHPRLPGTS